LPCHQDGKQGEQKDTGRFSHFDQEKFTIAKLANAITLPKIEGKIY
jgi:hypothetical protein